MGMDGERESGDSVLLACLDDDDNDGKVFLFGCKGETSESHKPLTTL